MVKILLAVIAFTISTSSFPIEKPNHTLDNLDSKSSFSNNKEVLEITKTISKTIYIPYLNEAKELTHIAFFICMMVLAIKSYKQAKKTVFSPIKTEIFKSQLKVFENVISHFQNKNEIDLKHDIDIDNIIGINSLDLFNDYAKNFMDRQVKIESGFADKWKDQIAGAIIIEEHMSKYFHVPGETVHPTEPPKEEVPQDPALKLAKWNEREHGMIHFTKAHANAFNKIKSLQNSPLLPADLKILLKDYEELVYATLNSIRDAINQASKRMPAEFQSKEQLSEFSPYWIANIHTDLAPKLEPKAKEILLYINNYLRIEEVTREAFS